MIRAHVLICGGTGCTSSGSKTLQEAFKNNIADFKLKIDLIPTQIVMFVPVRQLSVADRSLKLFSELN